MMRNAMTLPAHAAVKPGEKAKNRTTASQTEAGKTQDRQDLPRCLRPEKKQKAQRQASALMSLRGALDSERKLPVAQKGNDESKQFLPTRIPPPLPEEEDNDDDQTPSWSMHSIEFRRGLMSVGFVICCAIAIFVSLLNKSLPIRKIFPAQTAALVPSVTENTAANNRTDIAKPSPQSSFDENEESGVLAAVTHLFTPPPRPEDHNKVLRAITQPGEDKVVLAAKHSSDGQASAAGQEKSQPHSAAHEKPITDDRSNTPVPEEDLQSDGILAAVTHMFTPPPKPEDINRVLRAITKKKSTTYAGAKSDAIANLLNEQKNNKAQNVAQAVVFAAPQEFNVERSTRQILPIRITSREFSDNIRTIEISGLPAKAVVTAASRNPRGHWVLIPQALGSAELVLPTDVSGTSDVTITALGVGSKPLASTQMKVNIIAPDSSPKTIKQAHKAIANALILFEQGDIDGARSTLSAAVDRGNPHAAFIFAETFDPAGLKDRGLDITRADVERARFWYTRAFRGGFTMAASRLSRLPLPEVTPQPNASGATAYAN